MRKDYDEAVSELHQAAHDSFVTERKRLAGELKAAGDKAGAAKLGKLPRPSVSAWAVNQLWWHARKEFEQLFDTAEQLRAGKLAARSAHREALTKLSARARQLLSENGHAASESTLRRVELTLAGLAASGSFEPDLPGALSKDRDPPGFDAFGGAAFANEPAQPKARAPEHDLSHAHEKKPTGEAQHASAEERRRAHAAAERARLAALAAKQREAEAHAKREAEARELQSALREARSELKKREAEHARLTKELATAERGLEQARAQVEKLERQSRDSEGRGG